MSGPEPVQLALDLEAAADATSPCRFCQGRGWVSRAPLGWAACTWCEGAACTWCEGGSVDPEPESEEPAEEWFVIETRVYQVTAPSSETAIAAVTRDQVPVYHTHEAESVEARRPAPARPALRVVG